MRFLPVMPAAAMCLLALGGCGDKKDDTAKVAAGGEILPRSVSDDMLPYDSVRSQPPLLAPEKAGSPADSASEAAGSDEGVAAGEAAQDAADAAVAAEAEVRPSAE